jgi:hypothetical protein
MSPIFKVFVCCCCLFVFSFRALKRVCLLGIRGSYELTFFLCLNLFVAFIMLLVALLQNLVCVFCVL